ncbi:MULTISPECIES: carbonate dehydratase [unclassified Colwellia]|uniref:carbonate dehydratase n=1 Tax=unclassified Colwellia TaxID=196834 RepID=UPI0015F3D1B1|nr:MULTISPECIES: carbonate dehydratase [unclassified Colwellia]MBA6230861.1 carbonate dehydratase [Colwellia sp. MB02u-7]MBA6234792.1 carbonate dehydratase [Colwellia sp. MB02u-11]MBA6255655.1 carbonate dehydratase [Colwellia sp. MB3u-28]MBA6261796.1 carbonate dehydratase [Colwellia sp. MB3u-41]MBA6301347.1 carbonate dehydratase [Colwellia sp. MB3u-22]
MTSIQHLFDNNQQWADNIKKEDPHFFKRLSEQQKPEYLWIGCSDSRVPANELLGMSPGEVFVHRNIANQVIHTDLNCLSVIQFAVENLKVKHIIVCGHYGCGGIIASIDNKRHGLIDNWLGHIKDVYRFHKDRLDAVEDHQKKVNLLCDLNVVEQVANVCHTTTLVNAWKKNQDVTVHGFVYNLHDGILKNLNVSCDGK